MKKTLALILAGGMLLGTMVTAHAAKPLTVFEDPTGDADLGQGLGGSIPGGFDLVSGSILKKGPNLEFTVTHADMPPSGTLPEGFRFIWNFVIGKTPYRWTVKSADIGKPDVLQGQTTDRVGQVDTDGHFRIEGECTTDSTLPVGLVQCPVVGYYEGSFDPAAGTFTAIVPMKDLKAKPGSVVGPGGDNICLICWVSHYAERSLSPSSIIDSAAQTKTYKIPKK